ncbi:hypothetical protein K7G98_21805, partial [Saccharothrix sp. MB29]|nr:hypothetical protein [Saccharothrix sp. MB29]
MRVPLLDREPQPYKPGSSVSPQVTAQVFRRGGPGPPHGRRRGSGPRARAAARRARHQEEEAHRAQDQPRCAARGPGTSSTAQPRTGTNRPDAAITPERDPHRDLRER